MQTVRATIRRPTDGVPLDILGLPHTILVGHEDTGGGYELVEIAGTPGHGVPPHVHQHEDETFYVVEGEVTFTADGEEVIATAGMTVHLPRGVSHSFQLSGDAPARMLLTIAPATLGGMFEALAALPSGPPDPAQVGAICDR